MTFSIFICYNTTKVVFSFQTYWSKNHKKLKVMKGLRDYLFFSRLSIIMVIMILKGSYDTIKFYLKNDWSQFWGHIVGLTLIASFLFFILNQFNMVSYFKKRFYLIKKVRLKK